MATVHCKACGKSYSYEENGCCPSCGAYNRPPRRETVEADGTVHHLDDRAASTGRMPGGGGKVCFEEKICYEEQTRGGRVRRAPEKPRRKTGGQPLFAKLVTAVIIAIAVGVIVSVLRMIIASSVWDHAQSTPDYSWGEDWDGGDWDDQDWSDWDGGDWDLRDADKVLDIILREADDGDVILLHDCYAASVEAALRAIDRLQAWGVRFVTVEELFRIKGVDVQDGVLYKCPGATHPAAG